MDLFRFVCIGDLEGCRQCLEAGENPNFQNIQHKNWTALHVATVYNQYDCMNLLLDYGADMNMRTTLGHSPLNNALFGDDDRKLQILLAHGADINLKDYEGDTPFHKLFYGFPNRDRIILFLNKGGDYTIKNNKGETVYDLALRTKDQSIIELFDCQDISLCVAKIQVIIRNHIIYYV